MPAARQQSGLAVLLKEQVLLVGEEIGAEAPFRPLLELGGHGPEGPVVLHIGEQGQPVPQVLQLPGEAEAVRRLRRLRREADVARLLPRQDGEIGPQGLPAEENPRPLIDGAKRRQAPAVVRVAVGQHGGVHGGKVDSQGPGVFQEGPVGPHVEEDLAPPGLRVEGEPPGGGEAGTMGGVFQQGDDFHGRAS